ncbi:MAG: SGNH/GDSL hydrolase family protein [Anaerovoracaceae bacterium]
MEICVFGDSLARGVVFDESKEKYFFSKNCFVNLFSDELNIHVKNYAKFGCTTSKGLQIFEKNKDELSKYAYTVLEFGGNDCNFNWSEISENPNANFDPVVAPEVFSANYGHIIECVKKAGSNPVLFSLPPLDPNRFFNWVSKGLNKENILHWLSDVNFIYRWQEYYNLMIFELARKYDVPVFDIRKIFLKSRCYEDLLCSDGMHPNEKGHYLINQEIAQILKTRSLDLKQV